MSSQSTPSGKVDPEQVLKQMEAPYFLDYALFSGAVRHYAATVLEETFVADPNPIRRRFHGVNLFKEQCAAYEDAAAFLRAFLDYQTKGELPLKTLMNLPGREFIFGKVFERHAIGHAEDLFDKLKLTDWIPSDWYAAFPQLDLDKDLRLACRFFFEDCHQSQKSKVIAAYNKVKHGLLIVPSGQFFLQGLPDSPAMFFPTDAKEPEVASNPFTLFGLKDDDAEIENRYRSIEFIQCNLRLLAALYVMSSYPQELKARGIKGTKALFERPEFYSVRHFLGEVTAKK